MSSMSCAILSGSISSKLKSVPEVLELKSHRNNVDVGVIVVELPPMALSGANN